MKEYAAAGSFVYAIAVGFTLLRLGLNNIFAVVLTIGYFTTMTVYMYVTLRKQEEETTRRCSDPDCMMCERARQ